MVILLSCLVAWRRRAHDVSLSNISISRWRKFWLATMMWGPALKGLSARKQHCKYMHICMCCQPKSYQGYEFLSYIVVPRKLWSSWFRRNIPTSQMTTQTTPTWWAWAERALASLLGPLALQRCNRVHERNWSLKRWVLSLILRHSTHQMSLTVNA